MPVMRRLRRPLLLFLVLAGCSGAPGWERPGAGSATVAADLDACTGEARTATARENNIDQDILASRSRDWQGTAALQLRRQSMTSETGAEASAVIAGCMTAKGYVRTQ